tara:strand:+ start:982 stop:1095 length:114 start_codon:yes stop_codon:yes gene_type:complete
VTGRALLLGQFAPGDAGEGIYGKGGSGHLAVARADIA